MKLHLASKYLAATAILATSLALPAAAQPSSTSGAPASPATSAVQPAPAGGVADVLKMLDAGVSMDVIKTYVETASASFTASPADLIALKNRGVSDEVTMALLKHTSAPVAADPPAAASTAAANSSAPVRTYVINNRADPEGYDFFQRYYLMPRTLAYVNQTLGYPAVPYGDGFVPYYPPVYGYGVAVGYGNGLVIGGRRNVSFGRGATGFPSR